MSAPGNTGFTLLETLVALSITAMVSVLVLGGLSFQGRAWSRVNAAADTLDEVYAAQQTLRRLVGAIIPEADADTFIGQTAQVDFITHFAFPGDAPRKTIVGLALGACAEKQCLYVNLSPLDAEGRAAREPIREVLLRDVAGVSIDYFKQEKENTWRPHWAPSAGTPELMRIQINFPHKDKRRWPTLYLAPATNQL